MTGLCREMGCAASSGIKNGSNAPTQSALLPIQAPKISITSAAGSSKLRLKLSRIMYRESPLSPLERFK